MTSLKQDSPAPDFSALDQNNKKHSLSDYHGSWLVLYFYPRDNTPGCTKEACSFRDNYSQIQALASLLGVSSNTQSSHANFAQKYDLPFPLLADPDKKIINAYHADGLILPKRTTFIISPQGKIAKIYPKVTPADHAAQILKDLKDLSSSSK